MNKHEQLKNFYELTSKEFILDAQHADKIYDEMGFDKEDEAYYIWFESFAQITNIFMNQESTDNVLKHFSFFLYHLENGTDVINHCIDVSYIENLFDSLDKETSKYYWLLLPQKMQTLYIGFHGVTPMQRH